MERIRRMQHKMMMTGGIAMTITIIYIYFHQKFTSRVHRLISLMMPKQLAQLKNPKLEKPLRVWKKTNRRVRGYGHHFSDPRDLPRMVNNQLAVEEFARKVVSRRLDPIEPMMQSNPIHF